jgi:invasion protein IalB
MPIDVNDGVIWWIKVCVKPRTTKWCPVSRLIDKFLVHRDGHLERVDVEIVEIDGVDRLLNLNLLPGNVVVANLAFIEVIAHRKLTGGDHDYLSAVSWGDNLFL